jgi:hypothetical protein
VELKVEGRFSGWYMNVKIHLDFLSVFGFGSSHNVADTE